MVNASAMCLIRVFLAEDHVQIMQGSPYAPTSTELSIYLVMRESIKVEYYIYLRGTRLAVGEQRIKNSAQPKC